ncbi:MAG: hypothetical protein KKD07_09345 [Candidatus Omnitrophica bacterium]|nr:hypothetical protein [Candidatus Omnitrophota bacterium]MBU1997255.1 hypothetical protein [Candidatus Omnitrophota bacterium]MBU4334631.1 hypothetical protein [Candidatus Omnitrophota bacterium]
MKKIVLALMILIMASTVYAEKFEYDRKYPPDECFFGKDAKWGTKFINAQDWNRFTDFLKMTFINEYFLLKRIHFEDKPSLVMHLNLYAYGCKDECLDIALTDIIDEYLEVQWELEMKKKAFKLDEESW